MVVWIGFDQEGIYRLSGSALHLQIFRDVFDKGEVPNFAGYNADAHVVAGLLKLFLREMADPVVPFVLYSKFMEVARSGAVLVALGVVWWHLLTLCVVCR